VPETRVDRQASRQGNPPKELVACSCFKDTDSSNGEGLRGPESYQGRREAVVGKIPRSADDARLMSCVLRSGISSGRARGGISSRFTFTAGGVLSRVHSFAGPAFFTGKVLSSGNPPLHETRPQEKKASQAVQRLWIQDRSRWQCTWFGGRSSRRLLCRPPPTPIRPLGGTT